MQTLSFLFVSNSRCPVKSAAQVLQCRMQLLAPAGNGSYGQVMQLAGRGAAP